MPWTSRKKPPGPWPTTLRAQIDDLQTRLREAETHLEHLSRAKQHRRGLPDSNRLRPVKGHNLED